MMPMDLSRMVALEAGAVRWLVFHTAGTPDGNDTSAAAINRYHRSKGWAGIGYHWLIRKDGKIEAGRSLTKQGAHVAGLNDRSIGIAFSGNGDLHPLTPEQRASGIDLGARLCRLYMIDVADVIGHREVNKLIAEGHVSSTYRTSKSCPGVRVHPAKIRLALADLLHPPPEPIVLHTYAPPDRYRWRPAA